MRNFVLAAVALLAVLAVIFGPKVLLLLEIGAGYTAKQVCSCLYLSERSEAACLRDPEPPADTLVSWKAHDGRVSASALGLAHASARFEPGFGCVRED